MAWNEQNDSDRCPRWMGQVLKAAAVYNLLWGAVVIAAPGLFFQWFAMDPPRYPQIWQCVGMIVGVYGVGYWIASHDPIRYWPIILVGFLGKILGPIGFLQSAIAGVFPWAFGLMILTNDLIWWAPFATMLYWTLRQRTDTSAECSAGLSAEMAMQTVQCHRGQTLAELSVKATSPRHFLAAHRLYVLSRGVGRFSD